MAHDGNAKDVVAVGTDIDGESQRKVVIPLAH
jgi:hypothetical protein